MFGGAKCIRKGNPVYRHSPVQSILFLKKRLLEGNAERTDGLCSIKIDNSDDRNRMTHFSRILDNSSFRFQRGWQQEMYTRDYNEFFDTLSIEYTSRFFELINKVVESKNWVDIESEYYSCLKQIFKQEKCDYTCPTQLNKDLDLIKEYLICYLSIIQTTDTKPEMAKDCIRETIYEPFDINDISIEKQDKFDEFVEMKWNNAKNEDNSDRKHSARNYGYKFSDVRIDEDDYIQRSNLNSHINNVKEKGSYIPPYFLLPDQILLLNFNYTNTADLYIPEGSEFKVNPYPRRAGQREESDYLRLWR